MAKPSKGGDAKLQGLRRLSAAISKTARLPGDRIICLLGKQIFLFHGVRPLGRDPVCGEGLSRGAIPAKVEIEKDFDLFSDYVPNVDDRYYRVWKYLALAAVAWHTMLIPTFALLRVDKMFFLNIICIGAWLASYVLNLRGRNGIAVRVGCTVIVVYAVLSVKYLGWNSGFHYYILFLAGLHSFAPFLHRLVPRVINSLVVLTIYLALSYYSSKNLVVVENEPLQAINYLNIIFAFLGFFLVGNYYHRASCESENRLRETNQRLKVLAGYDPLTRLMNRRNMMKVIKEEIINYEQYGTSFAMIMSDIDDFKGINDRFGHEAGDFALVEVADIIKNSLRDRDKVARWGGEEFLILLPDTDLDSARKVAERIKDRLSEKPTIQEGNKVFITMTFGVGMYNGNIEVCLKEADNALYEGKRQGKNTVRLWGTRM